MVAGLNLRQGFRCGTGVIGGMAKYRLYCLNADGMSVAAEWIEAASDGEAVQQARALQGLRQCEVWQGNRLVAALTEFEPLGYPPEQTSASTPLEH